VTVVLHELGHGLGFFGLMNHNSDQGSWGFDTGFPSIYDRFTVNGSNQSLTNTSLFPNPSNILGNELISDNIFFNDANAVAANGGTNPKLYAPGIWEETASYGHLDEDTYEKGNPNSLMTPVIGKKKAIHHPGTITLGIFEDMGWTISSNVNPAPTNIELSNSSVVEHQIGAVIGNLTVSDVDSTNFTYTLSDNRFEVVNSQLKLKHGVSLDFETQSSINLLHKTRTKPDIT